MSNPPPTRRARFGLRTVFGLIALVAIPCAWLSWVGIEARRRAEVIQWIVDREKPPPYLRGLYVGPDIIWKISFGRADQLPWPQRLVGDVYVDRVEYPFSARPDEIERVRSALSEATVRSKDEDFFKQVFEALESEQ